MANEEWIDPKCGCIATPTEWFHEDGTKFGDGKPLIKYCDRHAAADELYEALQGLGVPRLAAKCFCQHVDTVEHTDECIAARYALALADGDKDGG